jgi:magnesium transporter
VISFEERATAAFMAVRERLQRGNGQLRQRGSDYLAYALIDAVVDSYELVLDDLSERIDELQDEVLQGPRPQTLQQILALRRELLRLRRAIGVTREMVHGLSLGRSPFVGAQVALFLRDVYDHTVLAIDLLENSRDTLSSLIELHISSQSHRLNEVMKVLTVIATIFIPLTFLVGVYGMNFNYMPELTWRWAYPALWLVMITTVVAMLVWFRFKRWL